MAVTGVCDVDDGRGLAFVEPAREISGKARGKSHRCHHFITDEVLYILIIRGSQRVAVFTVRLLRQQDDAIEAAKMVVYELHGSIHRFTAQWIEVKLNVTHIARLDERASMTHGTQASECQHYFCATLHLTLGENNRLFIVGSAQNDDGLSTEVFETLVRP